MADRISRSRFILTVLVVLILSSLACSISTKASPKTPTKKPVKTATTVSEEYIIPTRPLNTAIPTIVTDEPLVEIPTDEPAVEEIGEPTATKQALRVIPSRTPPQPTATQAVIRQATLAVEPTIASAATGDITVTAATGNLFVRRGPGTTYNIVAGFSKGVTTKAVGRNEKSDWLAIEIPLAKGAIGWISMGTGYTEMSGSIQSLPLYAYNEPKPAYLQNCTLHDMTTSPGQWNLPAKTTQKVNPGEYNILDTYTGQKKVQEVVLKEGNTVSIKTDGDGVSTGCP